MSEMLIKQITNTWVLKLIPRSTSDMQIHRSIVAEMTGKHFTDLAFNGSDIIFTCVCIFLQVRFSGAVKGFRVCAHGLELSVSILLSRKQWHQRERERGRELGEGRQERERERGSEMLYSSRLTRYKWKQIYKTSFCSFLFIHTRRVDSQTPRQDIWHTADVCVFHY